MLSYTHQKFHLGEDYKERLMAVTTLPPRTASPPGQNVVKARYFYSTLMFCNLTALVQSHSSLYRRNAKNEQRQHHSTSGLPHTRSIATYSTMCIDRAARAACRPRSHGAPITQLVNNCTLSAGQLVLSCCSCAIL